MMDIFALKHTLRYHAIQLLDPVYARWLDFKQLLTRTPTFYQPLEDKAPVGILFIDVTNICNAKCVFCAYPYIDEKIKGAVSFEHFVQAVDQYAAMGGKMVSFTPTVGDPLVDQGLIEKIEYAMTVPGITKVYLYTNGILFGRKELYKRLIDTGIHEICVSTAGMDKEMFENVYKVPRYDEFRNGLKKLIEYNRAQGEPVFIRMKFRPTEPPKGIIDQPDFQEIIRPNLSNKLDVRFKPVFDNWGGNAGEGWMIGSMRLMHSQKQRRVPCYRTWDLSILVDGSVRLCGCRLKTTVWDDLVIGHLDQQSLDEIFHSERCRSMRQKFVSGNHPEACTDCTMYVPVTKRQLTSTTAMPRADDSSPAAFGSSTGLAPPSVARLQTPLPTTVPKMAHQQYRERAGLYED